MKVEQKKPVPAFQPVTITLETAAEVAYLVAALGNTSAAAEAVRLREYRSGSGSIGRAAPFAQGVGQVSSYKLFSDLAACLPN